MRNRAISGIRTFRLLLPLLLAACADKDDVMLMVEAHRGYVNAQTQLQIQALVKGPTQGLQYRWFSGLGQFDPQESYSPKTTFNFGPNSTHDRVWLEVWRDTTRVGMAKLDVSADLRETSIVGERRPVFEVTIIEVPRYDPGGGPDTRAEIGGKVIGDPTKGYKVVIYAHADAWYIQPVPYALHNIMPDETWKSWTHTGSDYAALVVRDDYKPITRLDVLPNVQGDVYARTIVEGKR